MGVEERGNRAAQAFVSSDTTLPLYIQHHFRTEFLSADFPLSTQTVQTKVKACLELSTVVTHRFLEK